MFYLTGRGGALRNLVSLLSSDGKPISNKAALRVAYLAFVDRIGGIGTSPSPTDNQITFDDARINNLASRHLGESLLTDIEADAQITPHEARIEAMAAVVRAKRELAEEEPDWHSLFDFVVHTVFYQRSLDSGGGSTSASIGVIWCANRRDWTIQELKEFFVHEFAHNLLFIDERAHRHYVDFDRIALKENWIKSAILLKERPLDKAVHSIVVAHDVLSYRWQHGISAGNELHPDNDELIAAMLDSLLQIEASQAAQELLTDRTKFILAKIFSRICSDNHSNGLEAPLAA